MPPVLIRYWPAGCVHSEFWLGLGGAFVCGWGEFWTSNYPLHLPSFFGNTERDDKESRHDMLNMLKSETRQVPPNHITPVHPSKTLTWNLKDDAPKKRRWIELGHHHHVLQLFWCLMLKFEGLLVRFSHYLLTLSSFLQRLGALNARPEGLFWNFVCTWISFVGISANLHVFFFNVFFSTVTIAIVKWNEMIQFWCKKLGKELTLKSRQRRFVPLCLWIRKKTRGFFVVAGGLENFQLTTTAGRFFIGRDWWGKICTPIPNHVFVPNHIAFIPKTDRLIDITPKISNFFFLQDPVSNVALCLHPQTLQTFSLWLVTSFTSQALRPYRQLASAGGAGTPDYREVLVVKSTARKALLWCEYVYFGLLTIFLKGWFNPLPSILESDPNWNGCD